MSDSLTKNALDIENPDSAIMIAVAGGQVHMAYSLDLANKPDEILDILETAAMMVVASADSSSDEKIH